MIVCPESELPKVKEIIASKYPWSRVTYRAFVYKNKTLYQIMSTNLDLLQEVQALFPSDNTPFIQSL